MNYKKPIQIIFFFIGICIISLTYIRGYYYGVFENLYFWVGIFIIGLSTFSTVVNDNYSRRYKISFLFLFSSTLYLIRAIYPAIDFFRFQDELAFLETVKMISEIGNINVPVHMDMSKYYPSLSLLTLFLKNFSGWNDYLSARVLIGLIFVMGPIFVYFLFEKIIHSSSFAGLGTFIYYINFMNISLHTKFFYESIGIFFLLLLIWLSVVKLQLNTISNSLITLIPIFAFAFSHHFSSYIFILFITIFYFLIKFKYNSFNFHARKYYILLMLSITLIVGWLVYIAISTVGYLSGIFERKIFELFKLTIFGGSDATRQIFAKSLLPFYENFIDSYIYIPLIIILSIMGVFWHKKDIFSSALLIFGPILFVAVLPLIPTGGAQVALRFWGMIYIGVSFFISIAIYRLLTYKKHIFVCYILIGILIMGGFSIGFKPIYREPNNLSPKVVSGTSAITKDLIFAAQWSENKLGRHNEMAGDRVSGWIFNYVGMQNTDWWNSWRLFLPDELDNSAISYIKFKKLKYVIIDSRITEHLAEDDSYFDMQSDVLKSYPKYGKDMPLPIEKLKKFNQNEVFSTIYTNGNIYIYSIII